MMDEKLERQLSNERREKEEKETLLKLKGEEFTFRKEDLVMNRETSGTAESLGSSLLSENEELKGAI